MICCIVAETVKLKKENVVFLMKGSSDITSSGWRLETTVGEFGFGEVEWERGGFMRGKKKSAIAGLQYSSHVAYVFSNALIFFISVWLFFLPPIVNTLDRLNPNRTSPFTIYQLNLRGNALSFMPIALEKMK